MWRFGHIPSFRLWLTLVLSNAVGIKSSHFERDRGIKLVSVNKTLLIIVLRGHLRRGGDLVAEFSPQRLFLGFQHFEAFCIELKGRDTHLFGRPNRILRMMMLKTELLPKSHSK